MQSGWNPSFSLFNSERGQSASSKTSDLDKKETIGKSLHVNDVDMEDIRILQWST